VRNKIPDLLVGGNKRNKVVSRDKIIEIAVKID
jgi:hypothetical protein